MLFGVQMQDRFELQTERGNIISERCKHCGTIVKRRINRVHAKPNKWILIIGTIVGVALTIIAIIFSLAISLWILIAVMSFICTVPFIAWKETEKKASAFNKVMVNDE